MMTIAVFYTYMIKTPGTSVMSAKDISNDMPVLDCHYAGGWIPL